MKKIAIFDMDRTITRTGTYTPFLIFAALRRQPWRLALLPIFLFTMPAYPLGLIDRKGLKAWGFRLLLGRRVEKDTLQHLSGLFADHVIAKNVYADAQRIIAENRAEGRVLVMATASPDFYAEQIGARLSFDEVIATRQSRADDGSYLPPIDGANCYGSDKLDRIVEWLDGPRHEADVRFYSDHHSDAPVLAWADAAFAVNPNAKLSAMAARENWPILTFR